MVSIYNAMMYKQKEVHYRERNWEVKELVQGRDARENTEWAVKFEFQINKECIKV